jgi:hypothetical protein
MKEGDVILTPILQADDTAKNRPALILRELPPYRSSSYAASVHRSIKLCVDLTK